MKVAFDKDIYTSISLTKLTIFAISQIASKGEECAYERLVKECFTLFPERFSFQLYPDWPDGTRVKIEMLRCRDKGWVTGNERSGFKITEIGKRAAEEVFGELQNRNIKKPQEGHIRDRGSAIITYLKQSKPYSRYRENKKVFTLTEEEFRKLLVATYEASPRVLKENFNYCVTTCEQYGEVELCEFLKACERLQGFLLKSYVRRKRK